MSFFFNLIRIFIASHAASATQKSQKVPARTFGSIRTIVAHAHHFFKSHLLCYGKQCPGFLLILT